MSNVTQKGHLKESDVKSFSVFFHDAWLEDIVTYSEHEINIPGTDLQKQKEMAKYARKLFLLKVETQKHLKQKLSSTICTA